MDGRKLFQTVPNPVCNLFRTSVWYALCGTIEHMSRALSGTVNHWHGSTVTGKLESAYSFAHYQWHLSGRPPALRRNQQAAANSATHADHCSYITPYTEHVASQPTKHESHLTCK